MPLTKRIHLITDIDITEKSAQSVHVLALAKYLARLDLEVRLLYPYWQKEDTRISHEIIGVPIHVPKHPYFRSRLFQLGLLVKMAYLAKPDLIYIRFSTGMIAPLLWAYVMHIPLFVEINGILDLEYIMTNKSVTRVKKWLKVKRIHIVEKLNFKKADGIIYVTNELREYYARRYNLPQKKTVIISNGVDLEIFHPIDKYHARHKLGIRVEDPVLGFTGSLAPWYGIDDTIHAIKILIDRNVSCCLYIVGEGSEGMRVRALAHDLGVSHKVFFVGAVEPSIVPFYINAFDICLIPVVPERNCVSGVSPLKLYEYMACAKPIIATNIPGLEIVTEIGAGVNTKTGSPKNLADAIEQMIRQQHEWEAMGARGRLYAESYASWQHVAEKTVTFFTDRLRGAR